MISIIIGTLNHFEDALKPCIESIIKYTDFNDKEIIVVANGCTDGTEDYIKSLDKPFKLLSYPEPLGFAKAYNEGIKVSKGDYVILLNNDIILLEQPKDQWVQMLQAPFNIEWLNCGLSGPIKGYSDPAQHDFLIFFCVMIKREVFEKVGLLSEDYGVGAGEDTQFSIDAMNAGYRIEQVPLGIGTKYGNGLVIGGFPIYHKGEVTVNDNPNWKKIFEENAQKLRDKYGNKLKLNLGCGPIKIKGYINIDLYDKDADMHMDARKLDKFPDNTVDEVFSSHLFEHFVPWEVPHILLEWKRVLKSGGKLIMELPDLMECCLHYPTATKQQKYEILMCLYGTLPDVKVNHEYGWDFELLKEHLEIAGFKDIKKMPQCFWHMGFNMRISCTKE